jgi:hypothetical protein
LSEEKVKEKETEEETNEKMCHFESSSIAVSSFILLFFTSDSLGRRAGRTGKKKVPGIA